jgi:hypothetical protein
MTSQPSANYSGMRFFVNIVLAIWFLLVFFLGAKGTLIRPPEVPPIPILLGVTAPLAAFLAPFCGSFTFRALMLATDLRFLTATQAWRAGGLGFLALYAYGILPGLFAWPAGLGDIAIGVTAPWMALALVHRPTFAASRIFVVWNLLGILDLIIAVTTGVLSSGFVPGLVGEVTTAPMVQLPLVLIPGYFVPLFIVLHLIAIFQARQIIGDAQAGQFDGRRTNKD